MYSEDDIYDDNDDDLYTDGTGNSVDEEGELPDEATKDAPEKNGTIMSPDVVRQRLEEDICTVSNVLALSRASAIILLRRYKWDVSRVQDEWFVDEEKVRKVVGLFNNPVVDRIVNRRKQKFTCGICFDSYCHNKMYDAGCSHLFCEACWKGYISTSVDDGPGCLLLRCPDPPCNAAVGEDMINAFVCEDSKHKFSSYLLMSYIEDNKNIKWCPGPDCGLAIKFDGCTDSSEVTCECTYSFCWKCNMEAHRPVDCNTVEKWILKNNDESENLRWILVHSKPCPNCKRPIEKSVGCNHMTCSICGFYFCWLCLVSLENHDNCNGYSKNSEEKIEAKIYLEKYTHYYVRWEANHRSLDQAVKYLKNVQTCAKLEELFFILCLTDDEKEQEFKFIKDAWLQIIECRRLLKWSYTYGYYLPEHEYTKIQFFEFVQGDAESRLERLHRYAEEGLQTCLDSDAPKGNFKIFRKTLVEQTTATGDRFEDLVSAFKNGLSEVHSQGVGSSSNKTQSYKGLWQYGTEL